MAQVVLERDGFEVMTRRYPGVNQYVIQVENFGASLRDGADYPCPLEFSRGTQDAIDAAMARRLEEATMPTEEEKFEGRMHGPQDPVAKDGLLIRLIYMILIALMISIAQTVLGRGDDHSIRADGGQQRRAERAAGRVRRESWDLGGQSCAVSDRGERGEALALDGAGLSPLWRGFRNDPTLLQAPDSPGNPAFPPP